ILDVFFNVLELLLDICKLDLGIGLGLVCLFDHLGDFIFTVYEKCFYLVRKEFPQQRHQDNKIDDAPYHCPDCFMAFFTTPLGGECKREGDKHKGDYQGQNLSDPLFHATFLPKICWAIVAAMTLSSVSSSFL